MGAEPLEMGGEWFPAIRHRDAGEDEGVHADGGLRKSSTAEEGGAGEGGLRACIRGDGDDNAVGDAGPPHGEAAADVFADSVCEEEPP